MHHTKIRPEPYINCQAGAGQTVKLGILFQSPESGAFPGCPTQPGFYTTNGTETLHNNHIRTRYQ